MNEEGTQPNRNAPKRNNREYVPAVWKAAGTGGGAPKISGGETVSKSSGNPAPRGMNRPGVVYQQTAAELEANRWARGWDNAHDFLVLKNELGKIMVADKVRGNVYTVSTSATVFDRDPSATMVTCDCPDRYRLDMSGHPTIYCKHMYAALYFWQETDFGLGMAYSPRGLAYKLDIETRTAANLMQNGFGNSFHLGKWWYCIYDTARINAVNAYLAKCTYGDKPTPEDFPDIFSYG